MEAKSVAMVSKIESLREEIGKVWFYVLTISYFWQQIRYRTLCGVMLRVS